MTVTPASGRQPTNGSAERWSTVRFALESWSRTARLCVILFVASIPPSAIYLGASRLKR